VVGIVIDVGSIITTWTNNNETLEQDKKLKNDITSNTASFREAVQNCESILKTQVGNSQLQQSLRKLLGLRRPPPPPPSGVDACKMLAVMEQLQNAPFLIFGQLLGAPHDDPTENNYMTDIIPETDVLQLSQKSLCAPAVDSVFDQYPDIELGIDTEVSQRRTPNHPNIPPRSSEKIEI
jgi:hypothetical protein